MSAGMPRVIPEPQRAQGTSPLGTPAGSAYASRDMQDMYSVQRNILPGRSRDVRTAPKSLPQGPCNGLTARCTGPEIWSQRSSLPPSMLSRASSQAARMARSIPLAVNLMIRPVERLTA